jgi:hypothetical protein
MKPSGTNSRLKLLKMHRQTILARIARLDRKIAETEYRLARLSAQTSKHVA